MKRADRIGIVAVACGLVLGVLGIILEAAAPDLARDVEYLALQLALVALLLAIALGGLALYGLPTILAVRARHRNIAPIFVVNLFLGWTLIGWVAALAWSVMDQGSAHTTGTPRI